MDLSALSDDDLRRLHNNDYSKLSDEAKSTIKASAPEAAAVAVATPGGAMPAAQAQAQPGVGPVAPGAMQQAGNWAMENVVNPVVGGLQTAGQVAAEYPKAAAALGYMGLSKVAPGVTGWGAAKALGGSAIDAAQAYTASKTANALAEMEHQVRQYAKAGQQVPQQLQEAVNTLRGRVIGPGPAPAPAAAPQMQAGNTMAQRIQQMAMQRVIGAAAVPGAVAAGGAAATNLATNQMAAMTPEERKRFYANQMLGAMSGDAGLAGAIMNQGQ